MKSGNKPTHKFRLSNVEIGAILNKAFNLYDSNSCFYEFAFGKITETKGLKKYSYYELVEMILQRCEHEHKNRIPKNFDFALYYHADNENLAA